MTDRITDRFLEITINVKDADRSVEFYRLLGFDVVEDQLVDDPVFEAAFNVVGHRVHFVHLRLAGDATGPVLDICEWNDPPTEGQPLRNQNHRGITRFALQTSDLDSVYATLKAHDVPVLTEPIVSGYTKEGDWRICLVEDPDGVTVQLVQIGPAPAKS